MTGRMKEIKHKLQEFAREYKPRVDWHEPDEQEISAIVTGCHLDNAFGNDQKMVEPWAQEYVVHLTVRDYVVLSVNLADLLAIAAA